MNGMWCMCVFVFVCACAGVGYYMFHVLVRLNRPCLQLWEPGLSSFILSFYQLVIIPYSPPPPRPRS